MNPLGSRRGSALRPCWMPGVALLLLANVIIAQPAAPKPSQDTIQLDPFEVQTGKDTSYGALNSNSITKFNTELDSARFTSSRRSAGRLTSTRTTSTASRVSRGARR